MGATGSWGEDVASPDALAAALGLGMPDPKKLRLKVLQSSLRSRVAPTPLSARPDTVPVPRDETAPLAQVPAGPDFNSQRARLEAALEELNQPKDLSALANEGKRRGSRGNTDMLMALAAQQAGPGFESVQQTMLKQAMAARDPLKFTGGIVNDQGDVVEDPYFKQQEQRALYERRLAGIDRGENAAAIAAAELARRKEALAMQEAGRNERAADRNALSMTLQGMREAARASAGANAAGAGKPAKPMPANMQKAWLENQNNLTAVDRAISATEAYPDAFGPSNIIGDYAKQYTDPKGVQARAAVADIGSLKIHDRSGAAVTAMEFPRLQPFIPNAKDRPQVVKDKLANFRKAYADIQAEIAGFAEQQGYNAPTVNAPPATPPGAASAAAPSAPKTVSWGDLK